MNQSLRILENPDARAWDDFVAARGGHILQSVAWGELKTRFGWSALRLALADGDALIAGAQMLLRRLPLGLTLAYIPRGPVVAPDDHNTITALCDALCGAAKSRGAFALKIEPNWYGAWQPTTALWRPATGFQPRATIHVDLTRDLNAILAQMKPKWRYNIRLAERKGVTVRAGNTDDVTTFYHLLQITGERDRFAIHALAYYRAAYEQLAGHDYTRLFIAEYAGEPLAAIFVTTFGGEAIYLYGASGHTHRERMPNHALHWAAIQWAKTRGCVRYDLWGIAEKDGGGKIKDKMNMIHPTSLIPQPPTLPDGLYQFKQGFGGTVVRYASTADVVFSRARYALYTRAVAWRRGAVG